MNIFKPHLVWLGGPGNQTATGQLLSTACYWAEVGKVVSYLLVLQDEGANTYKGRGSHKIIVYSIYSLQRMNKHIKIRRVNSPS